MWHPVRLGSPPSSPPTACVSTTRARCGSGPVPASMANRRPRCRGGCAPRPRQAKAPIQCPWRRSGTCRADATCHHCHAAADDLTRRVAAFEASVNADPYAVADRLWAKDHLDPNEEKLRFPNQTRFRHRKRDRRAASKSRMPIMPMIRRGRPCPPRHDRRTRRFQLACQQRSRALCNVWTTSAVCVPQCKESH